MSPRPSPHAAVPQAPGAEHEHRACVSRALAEVARECERRGLRLTRLRRRVLELVWRTHTPVGAYELLSQLARERGPVAPSTVYRALDFLRANGFVHRIDSIAAFVGCPRPRQPHRAHFLICRECGEVEEIDEPAITRTIATAATARGFTIERETVEIAGRCAACQPRRPT